MSAEIIKAVLAALPEILDLLMRLYDTQDPVEAVNRHKAQLRDSVAARLAAHDMAAQAAFAARRERFGKGRG